MRGHYWARLCNYERLEKTLRRTPFLSDYRQISGSVKKLHEGQNEVEVEIEIGFLSSGTGKMSDCAYASIKILLHRAFQSNDIPCFSAKQCL